MAAGESRRPVHLPFPSLASPLLHLREEFPGLTGALGPPGLHGSKAGGSAVPSSRAFLDLASVPGSPVCKRGGAVVLAIEVRASSPLVCALRGPIPKKGRYMLAPGLWLTSELSPEVYLLAQTSCFHGLGEKNLG